MAYYSLVIHDLRQQVTDILSCCEQELVLLVERAIRVPGLQLQPDEVLQLCLVLVFVLRNL